MKKITLIALLLITACSTTPKNPQAWMEQEINACMPTAIAFREGLRESNVWAHVLVYKYYSSEYKRMRGHAIVAYLYPKGTNQLWTYDQLGSYRTRAYISNEDAIAKYAHKVRGNEGTFDSAEWIR